VIVYLRGLSGNLEPAFQAKAATLVWPGLSLKVEWILPACWITTLSIANEISKDEASDIRKPVAIITSVKPLVIKTLEMNTPVCQHNLTQRCTVGSLYESKLFKER